MTVSAPPKDRRAIDARATLADVRRALSVQQFSHFFCGVRLKDFLLFLFLSTGLLMLSIESGLRAAAPVPPLPTLSLTLSTQALDTQIHPFLQALLSLPHVAQVSYVTKEQRYERERVARPENIVFLEETSARNPFTDSVDVQLRSLRDLNAFFGFLRRPELQSLLHPSFLWNVPQYAKEVTSMEAMQRTFRQSFFFIAMTSILLLLATLGIFLRMRTERMRQTVRTMRLLGANTLTIHQSFLMEAGMILVSAGVLGGIALSLFS